MEQKRGFLSILCSIWPFSKLIPQPKLEFVNGIPRMPNAKATFKKFWAMSPEEIEKLPVDPELEEVFKGFEEMSKIAEKSQQS